MALESIFICLTTFVSQFLINNAVLLIGQNNLLSSAWDIKSTTHCGEHVVNQNLRLFHLLLVEIETGLIRFVALPRHRKQVMAV